MLLLNDVEKLLGKLLLRLFNHGTHFSGLYNVALLKGNSGCQLLVLSDTLSGRMHIEPLRCEAYHGRRRYAL